MKLLALNKEWAVFNDEDVTEGFDTFAALRDLLQMKNYGQLISFLKEHACNLNFTLPSDDPFCVSYRDGKPTMPIKLNGKLETAIAQDSDIDLLDKLTIADLNPENTRQIRLDELAEYQRVLKCLLRLAAVAQGSEIPDDLFVQIPTEYIHDQSWVRENLGCDASELRTYALPQELTGAARHGVIDEDIFDSFGGIFHHLEKYSQYQLYLDKTKTPEEQGRYSDGYPYSVDGVIYAYEEYSFENQFEDSEYCLTVSIMPNTDPDKAKRLLAGRTVEMILNANVQFTDQNQFSLPTVDEDDFLEYRYSLENGFEKVQPKEPPFWLADLFDEAAKLILEKKVDICPICKSPFVIRDGRGRKTRSLCSDSCKTRASNLRRQYTYQCVGAGVTVDTAIEIVGKEYEKSVRKWYTEAEKLSK